MSNDKFPLGWDEARVRRVLEHYENQTDEEATAEDEAAWERGKTAFVEVPRELLDEVRALISRRTGTEG